MKSLVASVILLAAVLLSNTASAGVAKPWGYVGQIPVGGDEAYAAETSVRDDSLILLYDPADDAFYLLFTYRGETALSTLNAERAEIYIRTREEPEMRGRYDSDYVLEGHTRNLPNPDPTRLQYVRSDLTTDDLVALREHEKNGVMGVGWRSNSVISASGPKVLRAISVASWPAFSASSA